MSTWLIEMNNMKKIQIEDCEEYDLDENTKFIQAVVSRYNLKDGDTLFIVINPLWEYYNWGEYKDWHLNMEESTIVKASTEDIKDQIPEKYRSTRFLVEDTSGLPQHKYLYEPMKDLYGVNIKIVCYIDNRYRKNKELY